MADRIPVKAIFTVDDATALGEFVPGDTLGVGFGGTGATTVVEAKTNLGLENVDNTSDLNKPVSTAQATAIGLKENTISAGTTAQFWRGDKTWTDFATTVRATVLTGLSLATGTVIAAADTILVAFGKLQKQITDNLSTLTTHTGNTSNPHSVTKAQVGLGSVDNTADADKPVSTATQTALDLKANLVSPAFTTPSLGVATATSLTLTTDLAVADGGTGRSTGTTAYALIATGTTATGAQQSLAAGLTTQILVGGGASALPVWTTATGSGSPVRATSPTLVTPVLGVATGTSFNSITGLSSTTPAMDGVAAVGTGTTTARGDHVHPSDTTKVDKTSDTGSAKIPAGTTAQRDSTPAIGWTRFNSTLGKNETWNGTAWVAGGGATGGGSDDVFYENSINVTANYSITTGKNAMSAGPITINDGVTVTIPDGSVWSIV